MASGPSAVSAIRVRVVVVNHNTGDWLQRAVAAVQRSTEPCALSVVDNASDDTSADFCRQLAAQGQAQVQFNTLNRGFASACNQALPGSREPFLCILNPDCELDPAALGHLLDALTAHPGAALAGAMIFNQDGSLQRASLRHLPSPWRTLVTALGLERLGLAGINIRSQQPTAVSMVSAVSGAVMVLPTERFRALGGFDEGYFLHCEDLDLFARAQQAGWQLLLVPEARAVHGMGVSQRRRPLFAHLCKHRSLGRYFSRHVAGSRLAAVFWNIAIASHFLATAPLVVLRRGR